MDSIKILLLELVLAIAVVVFIFLAEVLRRRSVIHPVFARKILHVGAISASAISVFYFDVSLLLVIIGAAIPFLALAVWKGFFIEAETGRRSFGIIYFAIAFFILVYFFGDEKPYLVYYPLAILAWGDGLATIVGFSVGKNIYSFSSEKKTVEGSLAFFMATLLILAFSSVLIPELHGYPVSLLEAVFISLFLTLLEAVSAKGLDNIWVPSASVYWLMIEFEISSLLWLGALAPFAYLTFKRKWLTGDGALGSFLMGWILLIGPEPRYFIFPLVFFLIGSLLSKLPGSKIKNDPRDLMQVFANGGIPVIFLMLYLIIGSPAFLFGFVSGFAFALSDTTSSEIGIRYGKRHIYIFSNTKVEIGESGAVTLQGTLAGLIASFGLASISLMPFIGMEVQHFILIGSIGFLGNVTDSLIGKHAQVKYLQSNGNFSDSKIPERITKHIGFSRVNNDITNLITSAISTFLGWGLFFLL